jgi:alpha-beta hydrolase superfamily lysophospholipase
VNEPSLTTSQPTDRPTAAVLMLHGGREHSETPVDGSSASWRRSAVMQRAVAGRLGRQGTSVWLLRYRQRGWNGGMPVEDARWALAQVRRELGEVPVVLLGHSMGARTAVHVAEDPMVRGVVGLAPWFPPGEPVDALAGRRLLAAHGRRDRITSYAATTAYVDRARQVAASAQLRDMGPLGHYLIKGARTWDRVAIASCLEVLAD